MQERKTLNMHQDSLFCNGSLKARIKQRFDNVCLCGGTTDLTSRLHFALYNPSKTMGIVLSLYSFAFPLRNKLSAEDHSSVYGKQFGMYGFHDDVSLGQSCPPSPKRVGIAWYIHCCCDLIQLLWSAAWLRLLKDFPFNSYTHILHVTCCWV